MKRDDVIRMAREAGAHLYADTICLDGKDIDDFVERLSNLIASHVAEECAKACEARYMGDNNREDMEARRCATAIRSLYKPTA